MIALSQMRHSVGARLLCPVAGMGAIWEAAAGKLDFRPGTKVARVRRRAGGVWVELEGGKELEADAAVVAVTAPEAAELVEDDVPERAVAAAARYSPRSNRTCA